MREILFRGKRTDNGEWIEGDLLHPDNEIGVDYCIELLDKSAKNNCHEVIPETVGEYTGLTDKNGKKIFEGDIHERNGNKYVVKYGFCYDADRECNYFGWFFEDIKNKGYCECFDGSESAYVNIIGNIYDNPELLKKD